MLLADTGEVDDRLRLLAHALDVDDHALAEGGVGDVVTDPQPELLRVRRLRRVARPRPDRSLDHAIAMLVGGRVDVARSAPAVGRRVAVPATAARAVALAA